MVWVQADRPENVDRIMRDIDALFHNSEAETAAETERAFFANFMSSFQGFIRVILGVGFLVVAAVVLIAANTSAMGVRERIPEIAVLKSLGFRRRPILTVLLCESVLQGLVGGVIGAGGAYGLFTGARRRRQDRRPRAAPRPARQLLHVRPDGDAGRRDRARRRRDLRCGAGLERRTLERRGRAPTALLMIVPLSYNARSLLVRRWTSIFTAGGIGLVVAVTILLAGPRRRSPADARRDRTSRQPGRAPQGRDERRIELSHAAKPCRSCAPFPASAIGRDGRPLVSPEIVNQPFIRTRDGGRENVLVRGIEPAAFEVHPKCGSSRDACSSRSSARC
jgi:hypothetical protein